MNTEHKSIADIITEEEIFQKNSLLLTPSENIPSKSVRDCLSSVFINRYCEGYPGKRYYMGQRYIDEAEEHCIAAAKKAFRADNYAVNVQSLSGSVANLSSYLSIVPPGGKILAMNLIAGGHLSHGSKPSMTSRLYQFSHYNLDADEQLNMDDVAKIAEDVKPDLIVCGASAYPLTIDFKRFSEIASAVNAKLLADISHISGLIITGLHPSPFDYADIVMTTTHKTLRGPKGALIFFKKEYEKTFNRTVFPGIQGGVNLGSILGIARALDEAVTESYTDYMKNVKESSSRLADLLTKREFQLLSGGTENHLMVIKLHSPIAREVASVLEKTGIVANPNTIQSDSSPFKPSGIRIGTPLICSRGMVPDDMTEVSDLIVSGIDIATKDISTEKIAELKNRVANFVSRFPILPNID